MDLRIENNMPYGYASSVRDTLEIIFSEWENPYKDLFEYKLVDEIGCADDFNEGLNDIIRLELSGAYIENLECCVKAFYMEKIYGIVRQKQHYEEAIEEGFGDADTDLESIILNVIKTMIFKTEIADYDELVGEGACPCYNLNEDAPAIISLEYIHANSYIDYWLAEWKEICGDYEGGYERFCELRTYGEKYKLDQWLFLNAIREELFNNAHLNKECLNIRAMLKHYLLRLDYRETQREYKEE